MTKIAFQGRRGAYSERASVQVFGHDIDFKTCDEFEDVYKAIVDGEVEYGVVPIENSTAGSVHDNYDLLLKYQLPIVAETEVHVNHVLMAQKDATMDSIKEVYSHPQALAQCSLFFEKHKNIKRVPAFDTAGSAEKISKASDITVAAIASEEAANQYNLKVLKRNMENLAGKNHTRFFVISKDDSKKKINFGKANKTSIVFASKVERSGFLYEALGCFAKENINLVKIGSRPLENRPWEYAFYVDLDGSLENPSIQKALSDLKDLTGFFHILGTYPKALR